MRVVVDDGIPVTVMWGEHDDRWPTEMQASMAEQLGVPAVELPGVGHSPNADHPDLLVEYLLRVWRG
jgi:pimeloyl-ACP methyl ester carboxylesterase